MKSNIKKKARYGINIFLSMILILISISIGQAAISASRTIDNATVLAGSDANVTVVINNDITQALSLQETIPSGWILTNTSDDADSFKKSTSEWVWFTVANNSVKTVKYLITIPNTIKPGTYNINGGIITAKGSVTNVTGDNTIQVISNNNNTDIIAPITNISGIAQGKTYMDNVTITLTATDTGNSTGNSRGSGVNNTFYIVNGGETITYSMPFLVSNIGKNTVEYWSVDNAGNIEKINTIDFVINQISINSTLSFDFTVDQSSENINVEDNARYNLTISNNGSIVDTYNLIADQPDNATVELSKNSVTVSPGNDSFILLNVNSSIVGTYVVNVSATSKTDMNQTKTILTTTNVSTPIETTTNSGSDVNTGGGGFSGGFSGGGGGGFSGGGATSTRNQTNTTNATIPITANTVIPTITNTTPQPSGGQEEQPIAASRSPGFEIIVAIGAIVAIYIIRK